MSNDVPAPRVRPCSPTRHYEEDQGHDRPAAHAAAMAQSSTRTIQPLVTRSSDGQMSSLANSLQDEARHRIKPWSTTQLPLHRPCGTARAIRLGNDWLEALVALPLNMFYYAGIDVWVHEPSRCG